MTNLELFPRGKGAAEAAPGTPKASGGSSSNTKQDGKKRKLPATSPGGVGKEKEWLFGAGGKDKDKQSPGGKRPRGESGAAAAAGAGAKGKVSQLKPSLGVA